MFYCCTKKDFFEISGPNEIGTIVLEHSPGIKRTIFANSYKFKGKLYRDKLEESFYKIVNNIFKFGYQIVSLDNNKYVWEKVNDYKNRFLVIESEDIDQELKNIGHNATSIIKDSNNSPIVFIVVKHHDIHADADEFCIVQIDRHTYVDGKSAHKIFNKIVEYYNAITDNGDELLLSTIENSAKNIRTVDAETVINQLMFNFCCPSFQHFTNIFKSLLDELYDVGEYSVPFLSIRDLLPTYNSRSVESQYFINHLFDVNDLLQMCRKVYPEVSKNSIICAVLVKVFHAINVNNKNIPMEHKISFSLAFDILTKEMRETYSGNYVGGAMITVEGDKKLEDIAKEINDNVLRIRKNKAEITNFMMSEKIFKEKSVEEIVGFAENAKFSFIVTNWTNHEYEKNPNFLNFCQAVSCANYVDTEYGNDENEARIGFLSALRSPVFVINFSPHNILNLTSFYIKEDMNILFSKQISSFFNAKQNEIGHHQEIQEEKAFYKVSAMKP